MEHCVCQICNCGSHRCNKQLLKDTLGQNVGNPALPLSETHESYSDYPWKPRQDVIKPLEADWYIGKCDPEPPSASEKSFMKKTTPVVESTEDLYSAQDPEEALDEKQKNSDENLSKKYTDYLITKFSPLTENGITVNETANVPKKPLILPPFLDVTTYKRSFPKPWPLSQMPNYSSKMRKLNYEKPDIPIESQTQYMHQYMKWDLNSGLRAPVPNERNGKFIPENNINIYNVPMEDITTFKESYAMPPMDFSKFKLCLMENSPSEPCAEISHPQLHKCEHHSNPEEQFVNRLLYRSAYRESYKPPCKFTRGYCDLRPAQPGSAEVKQQKENCPAEAIINNHFNSTEDYSYIKSCCGHHIFQTQQKSNLI